jgi:serine/threonine protein kinase
MFTNLDDPDQLKRHLGLDSYHELKRRHDAVLRQALSVAPSGRALQDTGDGYFLSFDSISEGVRAALLFQSLIARERWPIAVACRVALHLGEVQHGRNEVTGQADVVSSAIDVARHATSLAQRGQILLTRAVFDAARQVVREHPPVAPDIPPLALKWIAHGPYLFTGYSEPVEIFEVGVDGIAPLTPPPDAHGAKRYIRPGDEHTLGWRPAVGRALENAPHWILVRKLGEGGFGEVWLAEHSKAHTHRVFKFCFDPERLRALKREVVLFRLLKEAFGDRRDIASIKDWRFEEAPYFIEMEYTPAGNLADWVAAQGGIDKVPPQQRLRILAQVARALAAAHSVGVLHKDIKPSNVLMVQDSPVPAAAAAKQEPDERQDAAGPPFLQQPSPPSGARLASAASYFPRLTDFGIGILTDKARLKELNITAAGFTASNITMNDSSRTGTRMYAPPESLADKPHTVQGDVYGLGVMLYQLVVGDLAKPLASGWERTVTDELLREDIAACVDGDPARRTTAAGLARRLEDIDRRRDERRAAAEAAAAAERRRRRRRLARLELLAGAAVLLAVGAAVAFYIHNIKLERDRTSAALNQVDREKAQAIAEKENAQAVLDFLTQNVLGGADPARIGDARVSSAIVRNVIEPAVREVGRKFADKPLVEASVRSAIFETLSAVGQYDLALPHAESAASTRRRLLGDDDLLTIDAQANYAFALEQVGRAQDAEPLCKDVLARRARLLGRDDPKTIDSLNNYGTVLYSLKRPLEAEPLLKEAMDRSRRVRGENHAATIHYLNNYCVVLNSLGRGKEAEPLLKEALSGSRMALGDDHPKTIRCQKTYANVLRSQGRFEEAETLLKDVLASRRRVLGEDHPDTITALNDYAIVLLALDKETEAAEAYRQLGEARYASGDRKASLAAFLEYQELCRRLDAAVDPAQRPTTTAARASPEAATRPVAVGFRKGEGFWSVETHIAPRGLHIWVRLDADSWQEVYPDGNRFKFHVVGKDDSKALGNGWILHRTDDEVDVRIPVSSEGGIAYIRNARNPHPWHPMGEMKAGIPDVDLPLLAPPTTRAESDLPGATIPTATQPSP